MNDERSRTICEAVTRGGHGQRCVHLAMPGGRFCAQHEARLNPSLTPEERSQLLSPRLASARRDHQSGALEAMRAEMVRENPMRAEKVRENRLRRMAERQGYALRKSRTRDFRAVDYGRWYVVDPERNAIVAGEPGRMDIDDVEHWLTDR